MKDRGVVAKLYRAERFFYTHHMKFIAKLFYFIIYTMFNCVIPPSCDIGKGLHIAHSVGIVLHSDLIIGERVTIYQNVTIGGGRCVIGNDVKIGTGSVILGPVNIKDNAVIGALTFVNFDVSENETIVGFKGRRKE